MAAAFADRFVERVAACLRAEMRHIGLTETGASSRVVSCTSLIGTRSRARKLPGRALRFGIEGADRFQRVAEEIEPHRLRHAGREEIEDAAAHRIFAGVAHGRGARETIGLEPLHEPVHVDDIARRRGKRVRRDLLAAAATRWSSALTVVDRMRGRSEDGARAGEPREDQESAARQSPRWARPGRRAGNPRTGKSRISISGAAKASASPKARARWPSRATWTSTTARSSASLASARARSATQKASNPSVTEESVSEPPLASSAVARLRSVTMQGQFESFCGSPGKQPERK